MLIWDCCLPKPNYTQIYQVTERRQHGLGWLMGDINCIAEFKSSDRTK